MVGKTLSLCITNYNRDRMLFESFEQVLNDDRVSEIIVTDDGSIQSIFNKVERYCNHPKVKLFKNPNNLGCYKNKKHAISLASNEYVIIFDSDNIMTTNYLDKVFSKDWTPETIFAPDYVVSFDYRHFAGQTITKNNVRKFIELPRFDCLINTMNYFVHKDNYLKVWDSGFKNIFKDFGVTEPWTADTIYQNYRWLDAGFQIHVLQGLEYNHRINHGFREEKSHYLTHVRKTGDLFNRVMANLRRIK